jgi:hypothetical protein
VFEAWTKPDAFRAAHSRAGDNKPLYLDHPQFEGFEVRQTVGGGKAARQKGCLRKHFLPGDLYSYRSFGNGLRFWRRSGDGFSADTHGASLWMIDFERVCLSH